MNAVINHPSHPSSRCRGSAHGHLSRASSTQAKASSSWQHLQSPSPPVVDHGGSSSCWPLRQRRSPAELACPRACRTPVPRRRQPVDPGRSQPRTPTRHSSPERTDEAGRSAQALSRAPVVAPGRSRSPRVCGEREHRIGLTPECPASEVLCHMAREKPAGQGRSLRSYRTIWAKARTQPLRLTVRYHAKSSGNLQAARLQRNFRRRTLGPVGGMKPCRGMRPTDSCARTQRPAMAQFVVSGSTFAWNPPVLRCRQSVRLARTRRGR